MIHAEMALIRLIADSARLEIEKETQSNNQMYGNTPAFYYHRKKHDYSAK